MVNEPGLYHLIEGSRKKEAQRFKKWVRTDVLPQIRKTGSYSSTALPDSSKMTKLDWIKVALQTEEQLLIAETKVAELGPKAQVYDLIANAKGLTVPSDTAKLTVVFFNLGRRPPAAFSTEISYCSTPINPCSSETVFIPNNCFQPLYSPLIFIRQIPLGCLDYP